MLVEDEKKSKNALEANNMHYLDSLLVKEILNNLDVITIHDCFGVRLCEIHVLFDLVNNYYKKYHKKESYGLHILI